MVSIPISGKSQRPRMSIGSVLAELRGDFPDISISKIRFLETAGLVQPERTTSGYRKFSTDDLARLRYILTAQRDQYLPLKVIKEHLDMMARGLEPPLAPGEHPRAPRPADNQDLKTSTSPAVAELRMSAAELAANADLTEQQVHELVTFGIVSPRPGTDYFDGDALAVAATVRALTTFGLEPRHLRVFKTAAEREANLIEQLVAPLARQRGDGAGERAEEATVALVGLALSLHGALLRTAVRQVD
ncbi:MAG: MerR family transcriptional regulator [Nocardioidaceae bacterium]|nr:MerR family transcriptional regulator [Nocardioidaceae bacterium]